MHWGYVIAGWSSTLAAVGAYVYFVLKRGRDLIHKVPESRRFWSTSK